jgi:prephenate dehydrogenase
MKKHVPPSAEIIGLHPLFGPQSGKNGISGLKVVTCKVRGGSFDCVSDFMRDKLMLDVCQKTPEEHDKQMAYVQALNHLIARALDRMNLPDCDLGTPAYERLKDVHRILQGDSMELFLTIERENPFAAEIRHSFCRQLDMLEAVIAEGELSDGK